MKNKANYSILEDTPEFVLIKDIGPWDNFKTVTNAAEEVGTFCRLGQPVTIMSNTITTVKEFLEFGVAGLKKKGIPPSGLNGYYCPMDFVLRNGRYWAPGNVCWAKGASACYVHAGKAALRNRDYTYVEGYAINLIQVAHAWLVDNDGLVIETTWSEMGKAYYGIPFRTDYIRQQIKKTGCYSMIDQWRGADAWHTIRAPREEWLRV